MPTWEWLVAALVFFGALQLLALRYAFREGGADATPRARPGLDAEPDLPEPREVPDGIRLCPQCGAENGVEYTYCRSCAGFLGS